MAVWDAPIGKYNQMTFKLPFDCQIFPAGIVNEVLESS